MDALKNSKNIIEDVSSDTEKKSFSKESYSCTNIYVEKKNTMAS